MNLFADAFAWIADPAHWEGTYGFGRLIAEHLRYSFIALLIAAMIGIPLGYLVGHTGRGRNLVVGITGSARALPSLGLVLLLVLVIGVLLAEQGAIFAFVILGIPPILAGAYAGVENVDRRAVDAARSMGMTEWQILVRVEAPLGLPLLIGGIRSAALQIIATVTIAGYVNLGALGFPIIQGLQLRRFEQVLAGALMVIALALLVDLLFAVIQRVAIPRGVSRQNSQSRGTATGGTVTADSPAT